MNCKDVQAVVDELARDKIMDASLRETALAHADSCRNCALRLEVARSLTKGLRSLAAEVEHAPERIEASLVAAFREHRVAPAPIANRYTRVGKSRWLYIAAGVAAAAAMVMLISLIAAPHRDAAPPLPQQAQTKPPKPDSQQVAPQPSTPKHIAGPVQGPKPVRTVAPKHARSPRPKPGYSRDNAGEVEIATDFIPLVNRESLNGLAGGQLVRVELPRSAMMSFGLPINMERVNEPVKADVVVGQDGLARAIRFVR